MANRGGKKLPEQAMKGSVAYWGDDPKDVQIAGIVKTMDQPINDIERRWGVGRLPSLVGAETASRYWQALGKFNVAIDQKDLQLIIAYAGVMVRAWRAMDQEAVSLGHKIVPEAVVSWRSKNSGKHLAICHGVDASKVQAMFPGWLIWTTEELELVMTDSAFMVVQKVKEAFPGAEMTAINKANDDVWGKPKRDELDDEIPF